MYKKFFLSCLLALNMSVHAITPTVAKPGHLTRALATVLFYLPFLDMAGLISAEVIDHKDEFQADIIWAARDLSEQDSPATSDDLEPSEDALFFEGFLESDEGLSDDCKSFIKIWKFNRNPDACFRIRLKLRHQLIAGL